METAEAHCERWRAMAGDSLGRRFTHVYADGPAPYYTVIAPGRRGEEVRQWDEIKRRHPTR